MPMNAAGMASEIITLVQTVNPDFGAAEQTQVTDELEKFCQAIIDHIIANAEIAGTVTGGGSSSGSAIEGTVAG